MARNGEALRLYKTLMRESQKFSAYNIRNYALRRIRDAFKENKTLTDSSTIQQQMQRGLANLEIVRRQVVVGNLFQPNKLIIENQPSTRSTAT